MEHAEYCLYTPRGLILNLKEEGNEPALRCCSAEHTGGRLVPHFSALCTSNNLGGQSKDKHHLSCIYLCCSVHSLGSLCICSEICVLSHPGV